MKTLLTIIVLILTSGILWHVARHVTLSWDWTGPMRTLFVTMIVVSLYFGSEAEAQYSIAAFCMAKGQAIECSAVDAQQSAPIPCPEPIQQAQRSAPLPCIGLDVCDDGHPEARVIKRNRTIVRKFLKLLGRTTTPRGAQVDHIYPLACGGPDTMENLQLVWGDYKKRKEQAERECESIRMWNEENPCSSGECVRPLLTR